MSCSTFSQSSVSRISTSHKSVSHTSTSLCHTFLQVCITRFRFNLASRPFNWFCNIPTIKQRFHFHWIRSDYGFRTFFHTISRFSRKPHLPERNFLPKPRWVWCVRDITGFIAQAKDCPFVIRSESTLVPFSPELVFRCFNTIPGHTYDCLVPIILNEPQALLCHV